MPRTKKFDQDIVLQKAMELFWKKGYHDTSIQDLINFLGINRASLYDTFGGKKKLFEKALKFYRDDACQGLAAYLDTQEDVREALRQVFQKIIMDDQSDPDRKGCFVVNTTTEMLPEDPSFQATLVYHRQFIVNLFYNFLKKGQEQGQFSAEKDIQLIASLLYTLMTGLRVIAKTQSDPSESFASVEAVLSLLD